MTLEEKLNIKSQEEIADIINQAGLKYNKIVDETRQLCDEEYKRAVAAIDRSYLQKTASLESANEREQKISAGMFLENLFKEFVAELESRLIKSLDDNFTVLISAMIKEGARVLSSNELSVLISVVHKSNFDTARADIEKRLMEEKVEMRFVHFGNFQGGVIVSTPDKKKIYTSTPHEIVLRNNEYIEEQFFRAVNG